MATVVNTGDVALGIDDPHHTYNRQNAGDPNASLTPEFTGEIVLDTTNKKLWIARDLTNDSWVTYSQV